MNNKTHQILLLLILLWIGQPLYGQVAYSIYNQEGQKVSLVEVMDATRDKTHIFFGEQHNNPIAHWVRQKLTKALFAVYGKRLVLGAEMFEADNQLLLDEYFKNQIRQSSFESEARLWKNYETDYKPLLEFAKQKGLKLVATNIPRRYANTVFYSGLDILATLSSEAQAYIAPLPIKIDTTLSTYRALRRMDASHSGQFMLEAQAVKDATMAHFIMKNSKPKSVFLHVNGSYHSNNFQGIIAFLSDNIDPSGILTLATVSQQNLDELENKNRSIADFIVVVDSEMITTH